METPRADRLLGRDGVAGGLKPRREARKPTHDEARMGELRRPKLRVWTKVNLLIAGGDPKEASSRASRRPFDLAKTEEVEIERPRRGLGVRRHGDLHMVDGEDTTAQASSSFAGLSPSRWQIA